MSHKGSAQAGCRQSLPLTGLDGLRRAAGLPECLIEKTAEIQFGIEVEEDGPQSDGSAIHEDEFLGHADRSLGLELLDHLHHLAPPILPGRNSVRHGPHAVFQQRAVDEAGPDIQDLDHVAAQALEAPKLIGMDDAGFVMGEQALVKLDHPLNEARGENAHAAIIEQVDAGGLATLFKDRVIAQMRVAVDDAILAEGMPPGAEHGDREAIARVLIGLFEVEQFSALEPLQREKASS